MDCAFRYAKLSSPSTIRLLEVDLAHDQDTLHGTLVAIDLDAHERPTYVCLSYTWETPFLFKRNDTGDPSRWSEKSVLKLTDGSTGSSGTISITRNLHEFLIHMTRNPPGDVAYIWIDAICINQVDLAERSAQVRLMGKIYRSCEQTIVWLGPEDQDTEHVFQILDVVSKPQEHYAVGNQTLPMGPLKLLLRILGLSDLSEEAWGRLGRFFERSWFHRVWTVQESILPQKITFVCGAFSADLPPVERIAYITRFKAEEEMKSPYLDLRTSTEEKPGVLSQESFLVTFFFTTTHQSLRNHIFRLNEPQNDFWAGKPHHPVWLRGKLCLDPRDYVYAGLGLLDQHDFPVDYTKEVEDIFRETYIKLGVSENLLLGKEHPTSTKLHSLASWVPDLSSRPLGVVWANMSGYNYAAGGQGRFEYELVADNKVLRLRGFEVDVIQGTGGSLLDMQTGASLAQSLALLDNTGWSAVGGHDIAEAFWRTLITNHVTPYPNDEIIGSSFRSFCLYYLAQCLYGSHNNEGAGVDVIGLLESLHRKTNQGWLPLAEEVTELAKAIEDDDREIIDPVVDEMWMYVAALRKVFISRAFFTTRNGRMGIGHMALERGSRIFIVKGCRCPLVLREGSAGRYRLTGAVYVHGVMHGEMVEEGRFEDIELE
ncbi:heterokaryon incompatibility protein-domain-containing protein [Annulohypoxylon moriforme]|nr:heterokaryon incompatibility protein-domain-containing protein [Annulohypoxylon moriforme]